ncbi:hypothetical protein HOT95_gp123 [Vibrio phage vB_VpS_PG07]|uniref:Tail fiber protein n=1 Tax=Vibrio phage vB_VpS_PG07 TaxID=2301664 RepID=A0A385E7N2_9CAUD|nr:hypothetical protein HOT95_gp123 [Vibrio phage vB_VpS_PG07]AXQ66748.1 hypothetical protein [Vibrio phage vB_VpS_PG07]
MGTRIYLEQIKNTLELESKKNKLVVLDIAPTVGAIKGLAQVAKYQGAHPTAPTERVDGTALELGDYYLNTTDGYVYYYEGSNVWDSPEKNSKESETNAASSEANAAGSETAAANSASAALSSEQAAASSEANAASSASAAAGSESNAANSASSALASKQAAASSEAAASVSEANAATSETNAAVHAANAEAAFDNFDDKYLGAKASDPTTDNDGNPLQVGASYWNSAEDELRFWNGAAWDVPSETAIQAANTAVAARDAALIAEAAAEASETNAAASASAASTSESNAESAQNVASLAASSANTSANNAATSETNAATSESNAATSEANAAQSAADAQQSADDAANVLSEIEWKQFVRNEASLNQMREQNKSVRAASGFDHYGLQLEDADRNAINAGLWQSNTSGSLVMGRSSGSTHSGTSKTDFAVTHIAGFISEIVSNNGDASNVQSPIKFPEAPNGTVIYDSTGNARGAGNATLNLLTDVDPKYGNSANGDVNEAVSRAFEGWCQNGDFRAPVAGYWNATRGATLSIVASSALLKVQGSATLAGSAASQEITPFADVGDMVTVGVYIDSVDAGQLARISVNNSPDLGSGTYSLNEVTTDTGYFEFTFQAQTAAMYLHLSATNDNIGAVYYDTASIRLATEEVVIDRHDMFGAEFFLEEVSQTNPFVYPKGMVQSQATSMNGITTTTSNRPVTYYAVYDGDTGSQGKGVDFWAATDEQKKAMVSDETNNIFMLDDGRLVQWRMRQRTIAGAGNGDWFNTNSSGSVLEYAEDIMRVWSQGTLDTVPSLSIPDVRQYRGYGWNTNNEVGVFKVQDDLTSVGVNGECYFHVWGVVPRLNQGAYHPSFNPMGAAAWHKWGAASNLPWYDSRVVSGITSAGKCFTNVSATTQIAKTPGSGRISHGNNKRPDGKFYDAIYNSGQGGVIDYRLPSWDMSSKEEASKVFQKVVNGSYRGEEALTKTVVLTTQSTGKSSTTSSTYPNLEYIPNGLANIGSDSPAVGALGYYTYNVTKGWVSSFIDSKLYPRGFDSTIAAVHLYFDSTLARDNSDVMYVVMVYPTDSTVSGEFTMIDVIGDPAEILATPSLANGWLGGWIPVIPTNDDQNGINWKYTRKALDIGIDYYTTDNGTTWTQGAFDTEFDYTINGRDNWSGVVGTIYYLPYTAFAKQTKESTNKKVLNSTEGLGQVHATYHHHVTAGATLVETLLGKVATSASTNARHTYTLQDYLIHEKVCTLDVGVGYLPTHATLDLAKPDDTTPAVKALWYQTANNQQASMNFAWNELVWKNLIVKDVNTASSPVNQGEVYVIKADVPLKGQIFKANGNNAVWNWNGMYMGDEGEVYYGGGNSISLDATVKSYQGKSDGWGDDSTIHITDGTGTYTNLNGDTCLYGTSELAIPYGYTKNQSRAGSQVDGVDL